MADLNDNVNEVQQEQNVVPQEVPVAEVPVAEVPVRETQKKHGSEKNSDVDKANDLLNYLNTERALLEKERAALTLAENELNQKKEEEINSAHLTKVSTFFWLHYLFNIPFFGFIATIIFSFVGANITRKNYARARMIWHLISILAVLLLVLAILLIIKFFGSDIKEFVSEILDKPEGGISGT